MPVAAKINPRKICKPYLSHQRKYISVKYLKNRSAKINSFLGIDFIHSFAYSKVIFSRQH